MYNTRPRSTIFPIPFGLGVEIDHVTGSKWVVTELHKLGFSITYDEVLCFKQNVVRNIDVENTIIQSLTSGKIYTVGS